MIDRARILVLAEYEARIALAQNPNDPATQHVRSVLGLELPPHTLLMEGPRQLGCNESELRLARDIFDFAFRAYVRHALRQT